MAKAQRGTHLRRMERTERPPRAEDESRPAQPPEASEKPREIGGPPGPEPTRFGDWERNGRCIDF
jgi:hypothetical protein